MMEEKIIKLIMDSISNGQFSEKEFINKLVEIEVTYYNLNKYIRNIKFEQKPNVTGKTDMAYDLQTKSIIIYLVNYHKMLIEKIKNISLINKSMFPFVMPIATFKSVSHEINHANQIQLLSKNRKSIEAEVLKIAFLPYIMTSKEILFKVLFNKSASPDRIKETEEIYQKSYTINPFERMADIKSLEITKNILSLMKGCLSLQEYYEVEMLSKELSAYVNFPEQFPLLTYIQQCHLEEKIKDSSLFDSFPTILTQQCLDLPLKERIYFGFPITKDEQENLKIRLDVQTRRLFPGK